jgi:hypothetical protein
MGDITVPPHTDGPPQFTIEAMARYATEPATGYAD